MATVNRLPPARLQPAAVRLVLFGMPDAGKSSLLGALAQAAQSQQNVLNGQLVDVSHGLAELQKRLYEETPRETTAEIVPYPVRFEPPAGKSGAPLEAVLIDCDGRVANDILARQRSLEGEGEGEGEGTLASAVLDADALLLVVDASAETGQIDSDFGQFGRFLQILEQARGQRNDISGLPVYLVLTKCDLLGVALDSPAEWLNHIEERKSQVRERFEEFLQAGKEEAVSPFGRVELLVWATAVKRPALAGSPAKPREPYGVAELFRQAFASARLFRGHRLRSQRRLLLTLAGSAGLVAGLSLLSALLFLARPDNLPSDLELQVQRLHARDQELTPAARYRDAQAKIDELQGMINDPAFPRLPAAKQSEVQQRLAALKAYQEFEKRVLQTLSPRDARSLAQLAEVEASLAKVAPPTEYRGDWSQTDAIRRQAEALEDAAALRRAVQIAEAWYQNLIKDGRQVLDNLAAANLPARAKKVLDQAKTSPFPETDPSKLVPGGRRVTYATVFGFTSVAELRRQWEEDVKRRLEPLAKLQS